MTINRILELVDLLPEDSPYPHATPRALRTALWNTGRQVEQDRVSAARTDPRFSWKFVMCHIRMGLKLPKVVTEAVLTQTYRYEALRENRPIIAEAIMLDHPRMRFVRNLIQALLIIPELSYEDISRYVGRSSTVIRAYESLFFNVRDRSDDPAYVASLVFPDHRTVDFNPNYARLADSGHFLLRAAWESGLEAVLHLAGFPSKESHHQPADMSRRMERSIMFNALNLSHLGFLNQKNVPGMMHARAIITATKQSGVEQNANVDIALERIGMGSGIMSSIMGDQAKEIEERRENRKILALEDIPKTTD